jgi:hypothetical protein
MYGTRHVVRRGDTLWSLARTYLGRGAEWPRIWRYNNRPDIIGETRRGIRDPDLIFVGQVILIPAVGRPEPPRPGQWNPPPPADLVPAQDLTQLHREPVSPQPLRQPGPLQRSLPMIRSPISFKYRLDDLRYPPIDTPVALIEMRVTGDVLLKSEKSFPSTYVTSRGELEVQATRDLHHAYGTLTADNRVVFDPKEKRVTIRSMLVSQSTTPNTPATAIGVEMSSNSPVPKLRAEIRFPKLEGTVGDAAYAAFDVKFVVEITPKAVPPSPPQRAPVPSPQPLRQPEPSIQWDKVIGVGLMATAGAIVVATVVEDVLTGFVGAADDPASFAAAGAAWMRGAAMLEGAAAAVPRAAAPASVTLGTTLQLAH